MNRKVICFIFATLLDIFLFGCSQNIVVVPPPAQTQRFNVPMSPPPSNFDKPLVLEKTISVNEKVFLASIETHKFDCEPADKSPIIHISQQPVHGSIEIKHTDILLKTPPCNKKKYENQIVTYTPDSGFTGADNLVFSSLINGTEREYKVFITVK